MELQNKRLSDDAFYKQREEVLCQWHTGRDVNLEEAVEYHKSMPESRDFSKKLVEAKKAKKTLVQPRAGVPVIEEHIKLMQYLEKNGEADLLLSSTKTTPLPPMKSRWATTTPCPLWLP